MSHPRRRSSSKFWPFAIAADHYRTFKDHGTGRWSVSDFVTYLGIPLAAVGVAAWFDARAQGLPQVLTAVSILTGLSFSLFTLVFTLSARAVDADDHGMQSLLLDLADQVRANVSYGALVGITLTALLGALVMFTDTTKPAGSVTTWLIIFLGVQMLLTIFMVIRRVRSLNDGLRANRRDRVP
ncbi:hypothetical protein [Actinomycetospora chibensis]|uniref:Uncharacterized protein n=1 Tax=Actinomycetospora chibensis TaxID=663606 RepID=A0ABV9REJ1_9PSEU|nr:hypothetical protein [Actinomycetospora chibensis]MDD7925017.1 hypothetical protein [Actinomycetospora chibensis]